MHQSIFWFQFKCELFSPNLNTLSTLYVCVFPPSNLCVSLPLVQTFIGRFRRNMDSSQNAYNEDTSALVERLDCLEKALFSSGQSGLNSFQSWEKGRASQLTASSLVLNYRKRKINDLQPWPVSVFSGASCRFLSHRQSPSPIWPLLSSLGRPPCEEYTFYLFCHMVRHLHHGCTTAIMTGRKSWEYF